MTDDQSQAAPQPRDDWSAWCRQASKWLRARIADKEKDQETEFRELWEAKQRRRAKAAGFWLWLHKNHPEELASIEPRGERGEGAASHPNRPAGSAGDDEAPAAQHSLDFRSVHWYGTDYTFTPRQAAIVKLLWEAQQQGTPDVGDQALLAETECDTPRLRDVFRAHPAWDTMIVPGKTKGTRRLAFPR